jgi:hypothetical protein
MAELNAAWCCSPAAQETCCEPVAKSECCGEGYGERCGCGESEETVALPGDPAVPDC